MFSGSQLDLELQIKSRRPVPITRALPINQEISVGVLMEHTFYVRSTEKFPEISEFCKGSPVYPLETFQWKCMFHLQVFTRNHQFQAIHGDIFVTILNFGDEHQRMELVSNGTRSSFDGPLP